MRGSMARVHIALDGLPDFVGMEPGAGPHCRGLTLLGAEVERFESAWQAQSRSQLPEDFPVEFLIQSVHDDSLAPTGKHMLMTGIQQLPFELADGTWDDHRAAFTERVLDVLTRYAPRIRDHIIDTHAITAAGPEAGVRAHRRQHLPRRPAGRPGCSRCDRWPAGARYGDPDPRPVPLWLGDPSRRRGHGRQPGHNAAQRRSRGAGRTRLRREWRHGGHRADPEHGDDRSARWRDPARAGRWLRLARRPELAPIVERVTRRG